MALILIKKIFQLFLIMFAGFVIVKAKVIKSDDSMVLSRLTLYLVMPCMILNAFQVDLTDEIKIGLFTAVAVAIVIHIVLVIIGWFCRKYLNMDVVEVASIVYSNAGNLVIPFVGALLGDEWVIYSCAFLSVQLTFMWTHGIKMFASDSGLNLKKIILNPNMIVIFTGLTLLLLNIKLPVLLGGVVADIGGMIGPVTMLVAGMLTANMDFKKMLSNKRIYLVILFRMLICPSIMLALIKLSGVAHMIPNGYNVLLVTFIATMTPAATSIMQFAQIHNKGAEYASAINIMTTLCCIITMPMLAAVYQLIG